MPKQNILFFILFFIQNIFCEKNKPNIVVLCYHHNYPGDNKYGGFNVTPEKFREQLTYLKESGYKSITLKELSDFIENKEKKELPKRLVMLTFDDGLTSNETTVLPLLKEFGFKAVLFIYPSVIFSNKKNYLNWDKLKNLVETGVFEVGSHSYFHPKLPELSREEIYQELVKSKKRLESKLDIKISSLAYPFGLYDCRVFEEAKRAGYKICFTINPGANYCCQDNLFCFNRFLVVNGTTLNEFKAMLELRSPQGISLNIPDGSLIKTGQKIILTMRDVKVETVSIKLNDQKLQHDYNDGRWEFVLNLEKKRKYYFLKIRAKNLENKTVFKQFLFVNQEALGHSSFLGSSLK